MTCRSYWAWYGEWQRRRERNRWHRQEIEDAEQERGVVIVHHEHQVVSARKLRFRTADLPEAQPHIWIDPRWSEDDD